MDVKQSPAENGPKQTAGQEFVKRIGPAGCILFLALNILMLALCFTSKPAPIPNYAPPETTEYYALHPDDLVLELEENVFPALPDYEMNAVADGGTVIVTIADDCFDDARGAILRYFDQSLIVFERG